MRGVTIKEEASSLDGKIDQLAKNLEIMMDILENIEMRPQWDNQQ